METPVSTLALCSGNVQLVGSPWGHPKCASLPEGSAPAPWLQSCAVANYLSFSYVQVCPGQGGDTVLSISRTEVRASRRCYCLLTLSGRPGFHPS